MNDVYKDEFVQDIINALKAAASSYEEEVVNNGMDGDVFMRDCAIPEHLTFDDVEQVANILQMSDGKEEIEELARFIYDRAENNQSK